MRLTQVAWALRQLPGTSLHGRCFSAAALPNLATAEEAPCSSNKLFVAEDLRIVRTQHPKVKPALETLRFGQAFTDHMFLVEHAQGQGWTQPTIQPFGPISMHPASQVLHYGMCCFEGMKAYRGADGRGRLFRPEMNMARLHRSSRRLLLADFDQQELLECLKALLRLDRGWLPEREGFSIYIRPFLFSSANTLGVAPPSRTSVCITLSPVGPYYASDMRPISLFIDEHHVRAWPGGAGDCKIGGNYAPTIHPQAQAWQAHGTPQVLYTLPCSADPEDAVFSECGAMNIMFYLDRPHGGGAELITPPLDGTILPGVTRDSILSLVRGWGECQVSERPITIGEVKQASMEGRLREVFGVGTACIVQPVDLLKRSNGEQYQLAFDPDQPSLVKRITKELMDIQYGRTASKWSVPFE